METIRAVVGDADGEQIKIAGDIIKAGGLVAFPTETVYGLGADALNPNAAALIYAAKGRPSDNPLIIHIGCLEDLPTIAEVIPTTAYTLAEQFWPGPLTMIFAKTVRVPDRTTGGLDTVAVRMPNHPVALNLIKAAGGFVAAPSANRSGRPSPTVADHVWVDMEGIIDMLLDGGSTDIGLESTIVDMTGRLPVILRPGAITEAMLRTALGSMGGLGTDGIEGFASAEVDPEAAPRAPGMKYRHYAPRGRMTVIMGPEEAVVTEINRRIGEDHAVGRTTGVVATAATAGRYLADSVKNVGDRADETMIARQLFRILREFDDEEIETIYSEAFSATGIGQAIMNRLLKAAGDQVIMVR